MTAKQILLSDISTDDLRAMSRSISRSDSKYLDNSIANVLTRNSHLRNMPVSVSDTPHPYYDRKSKSIILSAKNPSKFLQELGSASDHLSSSGNKRALSRIYATSRSLARSLAIATVPAAVLISGNNLLTTEQKIKALDALTGASALAVLPAIASDVSNVGFSLRHSSDKLRTLSDSSGEIANSLGKNLTAPLGFFAARRVLNSYAHSEKGDKNIIDLAADKIKSMFN